MSGRWSDHARRLARPWRVLFVIYAAALTIGTHWPRLEIYIGDRPAPDKLIHLAALGGLTLLLWRARWISSAWALAAVALAWSAVDEVTQSIPGLGRSLSWLDLFAGQLGVVLVLVWRWALAPVGGQASRMRHGFASLALDSALRRPGAWLRMAIAAVIGALLIGAAALLPGWLVLRIDPLMAACMGVAAGGAAGIHVALDGLWRKERLRLAPLRPCSGCGASCAATAWDEHACSSCPGCGRVIWRGQWSEPAWPQRSSLALMAVRPGLAAIAIALGASAAYLLILNLRFAVPLAGRIVRGFHRLPADMMMAADLATLGVAMAVAVRMFRASMARLQDRQDVRCARCGHDLRGTPLVRGEGVCGECGTGFCVPPRESVPGAGRPVRPISCGDDGVREARADGDAADLRQPRDGPRA